MNDTYNILIVDDVPDNLSLLSSLLSAHGYKVRAVKSGAHALAAAKAARPDLILLDILMPEMNGYEVCRRLKMDDTTRDVPIIFLSALNDADDKVQAFAVGGVDYVTKPFQAAEVIARVSTHLTICQLNRQLLVANAQLSALVAQLQARNTELDAFAHTVAHDLKTPLSVVISYAALLEEEWKGLDDEETRLYLSILFKSGKKCANIVNELLLLAALGKQHSLPTQSLDMLAIIAEAESRLEPVFQPLHPALIKPAALPSVVGYGPWVEEVWVNYLSNAVKYGGSPPQVEIGADEDSGGMVRFWIRDNGAGIPQDQMPQLFVEFSQMGTARPQGHGLGLSIVRRIVERLGGQVGASSVLDEGSTFWFTLPALPVAQPQ